jgi:hypothetical protein
MTLKTIAPLSEDPISIFKLPAVAGWQYRQSPLDSAKNDATLKHTGTRSDGTGFDISVPV